MTHPFAIQELRGPNDGFEPELNIRPRKYVSAFPLPRTIPADHFRSFIIRADYKNVIPASGPGRNSVRVRSVKTYTSHLAVCAHRASPFPRFTEADLHDYRFDVRHMPEGCATWPALWWTTESNWPNGGEVRPLYTLAE